MELEALNYELSICKIGSLKNADLESGFFFAGKTDEEISLVCETKDVPKNTLSCDYGWKAFRIKGILDFSLTGILSKISKILADNEIGIFAVSTYNTDYILVKDNNFEKALDILSKEGYEII